MLISKKMCIKHQVWWELSKLRLHGGKPFLMATPIVENFQKFIPKNSPLEQEQSPGSNYGCHCITFVLNLYGKLFPYIEHMGIISLNVHPKEITYPDAQCIAYLPTFG